MILNTIVRRCSSMHTRRIPPSILIAARRFSTRSRMWLMSGRSQRRRSSWKRRSWSGRKQRSRSAGSSSVCRT